MLELNLFSSIPLFNIITVGTEVMLNFFCMLAHSVKTFDYFFVEFEEKEITLVRTAFKAQQSLHVY